MGTDRNPPISTFISRLLVGLIRVYRRVISPLLPRSCRFEPTCSQYAITAIERHGPARGLLIAVKRILRCHPLSPGGEDPVPERAERPRQL